MPESPQPLPSSRKGKDRHAPQPTDIAEKLYALQRKQAHITRTKERTERPQPSTSSTSRATPAHPSPRRPHVAPPLPHPNIVVSQPTTEFVPDEHDFSKRLKISPSSPRSSHRNPSSPPMNGVASRLYNPNQESGRRSMITTEPEAMSDAASSSYVPRPSRAPLQPSQQGRGDGPRLFDPRKDNPTNFLIRSQGHPVGGPNGRPVPTPKSSGDYISASSTSSYAHSTISSTFTLSSTTTDSSTGSALFDNAAKRSDESSGPSNALSMQLKKLYRNITTLENKVKDDDREREDEPDSNQRMGVLVSSRHGNEVRGGDEESEKERWRRQIHDHKELAEEMHHMLQLTLAPTVPMSLKNIPTKYNLIIRLWTHAFHRLLESLRRASMPPTSSPIALEHLQDFIYHAYTFYTGLLEERNLSEHRTAWIEALGDLARYKMAVSVMVDSGSLYPSTLPQASLVSRSLLSSAHLTPRPSTPGGGQMSALSDKNISPTPAARIDDSPEASDVAPAPNPNLVPSVGVAAARQMILEPEKERWRQIARGWFAKGLSAIPGAGKLHHHLGVLSRDKDGGEEELRGVYHFVKSMITVHPFPTSREAILPLWSAAAQTRRQAPDAKVTELFLLLQGMIFTNIQLDDFKPVLARFQEKLELEGSTTLEESQWIMMASINVGAILEYGRPAIVLRRVAGFALRDGVNGISPSVMNSAIATGKVKVMMSKKADADDKNMDVDDEGVDGLNEKMVSGIQLSPVVSEAAASQSQLPIPLQLSLQLTFIILEHALRNPTHQATPFARETLNPYITIMLTFLATILKDRQTLSVLERFIPWEALAMFFVRIPRGTMYKELQRENSEGGLLLTSGCTPLPEDWCLRGQAWGGKKVYERGFWGKEAANDEETNMEVEVLDRCESDGKHVDGIIEDEDEDGQTKSHADGRQEMRGRWVRVARAGLRLCKFVNGFSFIPPQSRDGRGEWRVQGVLEDKVARWKEDERRVREEEERRLRGTRWCDDDDMDVDEGDNLGMDESSGDSEDEDGDSEEIKALKARRRYLQSLVESPQTHKPSRRGAPTSRKLVPTRPTLRLVPGYTTLVIDTNILLSSLPMVASLVESMSWTVVVPLPVIMELDGLGLSSSTLGEAARAAASYINSHVRSHSMSLKIQTSKGNYLNNLNVRSEQVDFHGGGEQSWERNMDDLILKAAIWQNEHWVDRSAFLKPRDPSFDVMGGSKVVLISFDRMLRLKARSREVDAASKQDLASLLVATT